MVKLENQAQVKLVKKDYPGALTMETIVRPLKYNCDYSLVEVTFNNWTDCTRLSSTFIKY